MIIHGVLQKCKHLNNCQLLSSQQYTDIKHRNTLALSYISLGGFDDEGTPTRPVVLTCAPALITVATG